MANKTINGCYDKTTGKIVFAGEACDSGNYEGCFVASGEHAGQIAVTVSELLCDDTYYGCIDPETGNFAVEIPDNCCNEIGQSCQWCNPAPVAKYMYIEFEGITVYDGCCYGETFVPNWEVNGGFLLTQYCANYQCCYYSYDPGSYHYTLWDDVGCAPPKHDERDFPCRVFVYLGRYGTYPNYGDYYIDIRYGGIGHMEDTWSPYSYPVDMYFKQRVVRGSSCVFNGDVFSNYNICLNCGEGCEPGQYGLGSGGIARIFLSDVS